MKKRKKEDIQIAVYNSVQLGKKAEMELEEDERERMLKLKRQKD